MKTLILSISVFLISISGYSQHDHSSHDSSSHSEPKTEKAPHGGELKKTGKYQIEMVTNLILKDDKLSFYLLKSNLKPILNKGITGIITIEYANGTTETQDLKAKGNDFFVAQLNHFEAFECTVKFNIKGKTVSTFFPHKNSIHHKH